MTAKKIILQQNGMSIVAAMVGLVIMSITMMSLLAILDYAGQSEKRYQTLGMKREFQGELSQIIRSANCGIKDLANPIQIRDPAWSATTVYDLPLGLEGPALAVKNALKYGGLEVDCAIRTKAPSQFGPFRPVVSVEGARVIRSNPPGRSLAV